MNIEFDDIIKMSNREREDLRLYYIGKMLKTFVISLTILILGIVGIFDSVLYKE